MALSKETTNKLILQLDGVIVALEHHTIYGRTECETLALNKLKEARLLLVETPSALERRNAPVTRRSFGKKNRDTYINPVKQPDHSDSSESNWWSPEGDGSTVDANIQKEQ